MFVYVGVTRGVRAYVCGWVWVGGLKGERLSHPHFAIFNPYLESSQSPAPRSQYLPLCKEIFIAVREQELSGGGRVMPQDGWPHSPTFAT